MQSKVEIDNFFNLVKTRPISKLHITELDSQGSNSNVNPIHKTKIPYDERQAEKIDDLKTAGTNRRYSFMKWKRSKMKGISLVNITESFFMFVLDLLIGLRAEAAWMSQVLGDLRDMLRNVFFEYGLI